MGKIKSLLAAYGDALRYLLVGGITTLINVATFAGLTALGLHYSLSNVLAWLVAVIFAFVANKWYVFRSYGTQKAQLFGESIRFFLARLATLAVDEGMLLLLVGVVKTDELFAKIVCNVVVILLNYVLSKLLVFRKGKSA